MSNALHAIKAVAQQTGLSAHVIRIWEKRYRAVEPERTDTNRRLYSEEQVERLKLLQQLTGAGHSISVVATLPSSKLRELAADAPISHSRKSRKATRRGEPGDFVEECVDAVKGLDTAALETTLKQAATELGSQGLLQRVVAPLAQKIGELWRDGSVSAAHEHFASAVIRVILGNASKSFAGTEGAPILVVATPPGQLHELGALLVGAAAANIGWRVTYLGASLPAAEIAGAAQQNRAKAVALSLVYPDDDPRLEGELKRLHELLPSGVSLLVGGRAKDSYKNALEKINAYQISDLDHLCSTLDEIRKPVATS